MSFALTGLAMSMTCVNNICYTWTIVQIQMYFFLGTIIGEVYSTQSLFWWDVIKKLYIFYESTVRFKFYFHYIYVFFHCRCSDNGEHMVKQSVKVLPALHPRNLFEVSAIRHPLNRLLRMVRLNFHWFSLIFTRAAYSPLWTLRNITLMLL